jgi:archaemetzincin
LNNTIPLDHCYDTQRGQHDSTCILLTLKQKIAASESSKVLAVIPHDLYIPVLTFVFGEAELSGMFAVVSYHRLANERYGLPADQSLLMERLTKESLHEIGHLAGLVHCFEPGCVMRASMTVEDIDVKSDHYCRMCRMAIYPDEASQSAASLSASLPA